MKLACLIIAIIAGALGLAFGSNAILSGVLKAVAGVSFISWFILHVFVPLEHETPEKH